MKLTKVWGLIFGMTLVFSLLIQLVILPHLVPSLNAGEGILVQTDAFLYHKLAKEQAIKIGNQGWSAWEMRPHDIDVSNNQPLVGIASAVYAVFTPKPWTMIPINSAVHATAGLILFVLLSSLIHWKGALLGTLVFSFIPSTAHWYSQLMRDDYSILGFLLFLLGWVTLFKMSLSFLTGKAVREWKKNAALSGAAIIASGLFFWIGRPYQIAMMDLLTKLALAVIVVGYLGFIAYRLNKSKRFKLSHVATAFGLLFVIFGSVKALDVYPADVSASSSKPNPYLEKKKKRLETKAQWKKTPYLPNTVDLKLFSIANVRRLFTDTSLGVGATSVIDAEVQFKSATEVLAYIPRSLQIGFLAPFPQDWFSSGSRKDSGFTRTIASLEMLLAYLSFICLILFGREVFRRFDFWIISFFSVSMLISYALAVNTLGILYRTRFPFVMIFVAMGVGFLLTTCLKYAAQSKGRKKVYR